MVAKNPSLSLATTPKGAGMIHQDGLNNSQPYNKESYNTFDRSKLRLLTTRFSDIRPYDFITPINGDVVRDPVAFDLSTYTMKSRLLTPMTMHMDTFTVPLSAIMPNSWEYVVRQPVKGQDISDGVYPVWHYLSYIENVINWLDDSNASDIVKLKVSLAFSEIFSHDGLLKSLGVSTPFADIAEDLYSAIVDAYVASQTVNSITVLDADGVTAVYPMTTLPEVFNTLNRLWKGELGSIKSGTSVIPYSDYSGSFSGQLQNLLTYLQSADGTSVRSVDMRRVFAYQMACAQFYSNSHIDDIYTGKMWLDNLLAYFGSLVNGGADYFTINGVHVLYDACSGYYFDSCVSGYPEEFEMLSNIFAIRSSLRQPDYFVESRLQPLATGDFTASVDNNAVSVIDVNEKMWWQRLANAVNRSNSEINRYLNNIFGVERQRIEPQPNWVISEAFPLNNPTVENTGSAQQSDANSVTSRMSKSASKFMYEIFIDEPSYVISLVSYSTMLVYPMATDKDAYFENRFDEFNPFLQHVGDEEVYMSQLDANFGWHDNFGYQLRYSYAKDAISHAVGGFSHGALPTWALMWPTTSYLALNNETDFILSPSFIRNRDAEIDALYTSLTGKCPADRFHFILSIYSDTKVNSKQQAYPTLM